MSGINAVSSTGLATRAADAATDTAQGLIQASRTGGVLNTRDLAAKVGEAMRRDPPQGAALKEQVERQLSPTDAKRFNDDLAAASAAQKQELLLDLGQIGLDVVGLFDPTPISDGVNGVISLFRGDFLGAGISAVSMIPYIGDAAKLGKLGKWAETVAKAVDLAKTDAAFARAIRPALEKIAGALDSAPLDKLPSGARETLEGLKRNVDGALAPAARRTDEVVAAARPRVELAPGDKDAGWNKALNGPLQPNTDYVVGRYTYATDEAGRVKEVTGRLELNTHDRNTYQQRQAGKENGIKDGQANDQGGHLIAAIFNGPGEQINYHAMQRTLNLSGWKKMENDWAEALAAGKAVDVNIKAVFDGASKRPEAFRVEYSIDGQKFTRTFFNE